MVTSTSDTAAKEYATRPADERFPSVEALIAHAKHEREMSRPINYNAKDLVVVPSGGTVMLQSPKGSAGFTHWSFGQLCRSLGAPASYLRNELTPDLAAQCLTHGLKSSDSGTVLNLLLRGQNGAPPKVRACTSDLYGRLWDDELYGSLQSRILATDSRWTTPPTWTGEPAGAYRGDRDSFVIVVNGGSIVTDPSLTRSTHTGQDATNGANGGPHDGMYRGILIRNSEVGAASVSIETILYRYICGNHMLWGAMSDTLFRRRHFGMNVLRDTVREISSIARKWAEQSPARDEAIIRGLIDLELAHTKEGVIDELRKIGFTKDQATEAYDRTERTEPASPRSYWGLAQGVTRMSQESDGHQDDRYTMDKLAAQLLAKGRKLVAA